MAISAKAIRAGLKIRFGGNMKKFTISGLNPAADEDSLLLLVEAISLLQGTAPLEVISTCEYRLDNNDINEEDDTEQDNTVGGEGGSAGVPIKVSTSVADTVSFIGRDDITAAEGASFRLYSDASFTTEITGTATIELISNAATTIYIIVTDRNGVIERFAVEVTRSSGNGSLLNVAGQYITAGGEAGTAGASGIEHVFFHDTG